jgi:hypothetical protein
MTKRNHQTVREKFTNGMLVVWGDECVKSNGNVIVGVTVEGRYGEAIFAPDSAGKLALRSVFGFAKDMAIKFAQGLRESAGSWQFVVGNNGKPHYRRVSHGDVQPRAQYTRKVYFWAQKRKGKNGKIRFCHSHDLCSTPMGQEFEREWRKDKQGYMLAHPELCSDLTAITE